MNKKKEEKIISDMLLQYGFEPYLKGFKFWVSSILIMHYGKTKTMEQVYDEIAKEFGETNSKVERAMRNSREHTRYNCISNKKLASKFLLEYIFKTLK